jgi:DNA-binding CsgD family transcriptional regulator
MANLGGAPARNVALRREAIASLDPSASPIRAALMHERYGRALWAQGESAASLAEYERAVAIMPADPPSAERARVLAGYGQILMLLDKWQASRDLCQEAIDIALQVGAREAEGHARNTLGLDLAAQGDCERAVAELESALAIAIEVGNIDDIGRAHVNLSEALSFCGLGERSAAAVDRGIEAADRYGIASSYGAYIRHNGILVNFELGRWDRAAALAAESADILPVGTVTADRYRISRWVPLLVASGDADVAHAQLDRLRDLLDGVPLEAQFSGNYYAAAAELALWEGRPSDAVSIAEDGLARLGDGGWRWYNTRLLRVAAWAAADAAEVARARRDRTGPDHAVERGEALSAERDRQLTATLDVELGLQAENTKAERATADAEDTRLHGDTDVAAWTAARERWSTLDRPYLLAYTGWREGQALLAAGDKPAAILALRRADAIATSLGAHPLADAIASLARRARIDLPDPAMDGSPEASATSAARAAPPDPFGLTRREREVLGLVALGRTNRQIAEELFISENTAGVHVSNILGKLGVASRTEAAAIAVRLDMGGAAPAASEAD